MFQLGSQNLTEGSDGFYDNNVNINESINSLVKFTDYLRTSIEVLYKNVIDTYTPYVVNVVNDQESSDDESPPRIAAKVWRKLGRSLNDFSTCISGDFAKILEMVPEISQLLHTYEYLKQELKYLENKPSLKRNTDEYNDKVEKLNSKIENVAHSYTSKVQRYNMRLVDLQGILNSLNKKEISYKSISRQQVIVVPLKKGLEKLNELINLDTKNPEMGRNIAAEIEFWFSDFQTTINNLELMKLNKLTGSIKSTKPPQEKMDYIEEPTTSLRQQLSNLQTRHQVLEEKTQEEDTLQISESLNMENAELNKNLKDLENQNKEYTDNIDKLTKKNEELDRDVRKLQIIVSQHDLEAEGLDKKEEELEEREEKLVRNQSKYADMVQNLEEREAKLQEYAQVITEKENEVKAKEEQLLQDQEHLENLQGENAKHKKEVEQFNQEKAEIIERETQMQNLQTALEKQRQALKIERNAMNDYQERTEVELKELSDQLEANNKENENLNKLLQKERSESMVLHERYKSETDDYKSLLQIKDNKIKRLNETISKLHEEHSKDETELKLRNKEVLEKNKQLEERLFNLMEENERINTKMQQLKDDVDVLNATSIGNAQLLEQLSDMQFKVDDLKVQNQELADEKLRIQSKITEIESREKLLQDNVDQLNKAALDNKKKLKMIQNVLKERSKELGMLERQLVEVKREYEQKVQELEGRSGISKEIIQSIENLENIQDFGNGGDIEMKLINESRKRRLQREEEDENAPVKKENRNTELDLLRKREEDMNFQESRITGKIRSNVEEYKQAGEKIRKLNSKLKQLQLDLNRLLQQEHVAAQKLRSQDKLKAIVNKEAEIVGSIEKATLETEHIQRRMKQILDETLEDANKDFNLQGQRKEVYEKLISIFVKKYKRKEEIANQKILELNRIRNEIDKESYEPQMAENVELESSEFKKIDEELKKLEKELKGQKHRLNRRIEELKEKINSAKQWYEERNVERKVIIPNIESPSIKHMYDELFDDIHI